MTETAARSSLQRYMDRLDLPHEIRDGTLHVHANLCFSGTKLRELPDDLTVHGALHISGTRITRLPDRLVVMDSLFADQTPLVSVPEDLAVDGDLSLTRSQVTRLPHGLRVGGSLNLKNTPIQGLPYALDVCGNLNLKGTSMARFPPGLRVCGRITPPSGLLDVAAFLETEAPPVVLSLDGSQHHRLALRAQLHTYPDVWRIVAALGPRQRLRIWRTPEDKILPQVEEIPG